MLTAFLLCLGDDLNLEANSNFTFITDRQKGLLPALKDLFPAAEHRYCVRHIHDNMNLIYKGGHYKELIWKCATATTEVHFERGMDEFIGDSPVITALVYVREYLMKRIVIVQKVIEKSQGPLTPTVTKIFNAIKEKVSEYVVVWNGAELFQVNEVACIFNMNDNGMQINPVPGREFWEKSQVPSRLIPSYILPQVGRLGKKRKKSTGELTEMVKDGKLIRKGGTVTCCKCGQKGHNKRSCKGTSVAGSGFASASASQPASQPARAKQLQRQPQRAAMILNGDGPIQVTTDENGVETKYQLRFHVIKDAKTLWDAIKSRFGGNVKSKKMQKNVLKQQFKNFSILDTEGLLLPSSRKHVALIMRNKDGIDDLDIDDLYNNLKVFEVDIKGSFGSSLNSQNVAFLSAEDTSNSNESNSPQLENKDLEQIDHDDLEEIDFKWQVAMLSMRVLIKLRLNALTVIEGAILQGNVKHQEIKGTGIEMQGIRDNALIIQDGLGYDWSYVAQDEPTKFALMTYTSNSSGSDTEVQSCSKNYVKTYEKLQNSLMNSDKLLVKANLEIVAYQLGLESVEAQSVVHQKNEVVYEEKIVVLEFEVKDKSNAITRLKNQLDETLREKDDLKAKLEQFETSSKNLNKLINMYLIVGVNNAGQIAVNVVKGSGVTAVKALAGCGNPQQALKNKVIFNNGCFRHMTWNKDFLTDYQDIDGGFIAFGGGTRGGKITGKEKIS
ncbi:ribonuclease H-like domain-containing protein [Tanacetum coccineum]